MSVIITTEIQCDTCFETEHVDLAGLRKAYPTKARKRVKDNGWKCYREGGRYRHTCPYCLGTDRFYWSE